MHRLLLYLIYSQSAVNPRKIKGVEEANSKVQDGDLIHPFEIITIGGDDILLIVPADKALQIAKMIGEQFEKILLEEVPLKDIKIKGDYKIPLHEQPVTHSPIHRYSTQQTTNSSCQLSMSIGVLITAYTTPIYYAQDLTNQLLKSAKKRQKKLKKIGYHGGTVDFITMKSVTMISSNIEQFRKEALTKDRVNLYASPYTLYELEGLIKAIQALKEAKFPKSQLYQVRSLLEQGKQTAILNYRYFRTRLKQGKEALKENFEYAWCQAKTNEGNISPWMYETSEQRYETLWWEMVDLYDFIEEPETEASEHLKEAKL